MIDGGGWYVIWKKDSSKEMVACFVQQADVDSAEPYVISKDGRYIQPAGTRGDYTLQHPNLLGRGS